MIPNTPPLAGAVLRYGYLWQREADEGRDEGAKDRPVALLLARVSQTDECVVLPITHSPPSEPATALEIPAAERARLGLDDMRSWIVLTEVNAFVWPGPDLRAIPGRSPSTVVYGALSKGFFATVLARAQALIRAGGIGRVSRSE